MRQNSWLVLLGVSLVAALNGLPARADAPSCPDAAQGETPEDCPWAGAARALTVEAEADRALAPKFKELLPKLALQLKSDSLHDDWKALWGQSINYDEYAKGVIVHPAILKLLQETFGVSVGDRISHAGLEHTYGYLFSNLKTPFGYKRARWVKVGADQGFELRGNPLSPMPEEGTFFSNATYFLGSIALRDRPAELKTLKKGASRVAKVLTRFPYAKLKPWRITETVEVGKKKTVVLRTDIVPFIQVPAGQKNSHLLIYSVVDSSEKNAHLITAFPVESSFVEKISQPDLFGEKKPVITRYNAYVEGLTGANLTGKRELFRPRAKK